MLRFSECFQEVFRIGNGGNENENTRINNFFEIKIKISIDGLLVKIKTIKIDLLTVDKDIL